MFTVILSIVKFLFETRIWIQWRSVSNKLYSHWTDSQFSDESSDKSRILLRLSSNELISGGFMDDGLFGGVVLKTSRYNEIYYVGK